MTISARQMPSSATNHFRLTGVPFFMAFFSHLQFDPGVAFLGSMFTAQRSPACFGHSIQGWRSQIELPLLDKAGFICLEEALPMGQGNELRIA